MKGSMSTFKRYEKKYMLNHVQFDAFQQAIRPNVEADAFHDYSICNIYYDTDTFEIIRNSIEKPLYKEKLRIRSYGTPEDKDTVFFELKKKYKKEVFKRRISISADELKAYTCHGIRPDASQQVMGEIEFFMWLYNPQPKVYIAYERTAFKGREDSSLRITFDRNIRFRRDDLCLCNGDYGTRILDDKQRLMEIKVEGAMPLWLTKALDENNIFPTSFSKYGYCYQNYILKENQTAEQKTAVKYVS